MGGREKQLGQDAVGAVKDKVTKASDAVGEKVGNVKGAVEVR